MHTNNKRQMRVCIAQPGVPREEEVPDGPEITDPALNILTPAVNFKNLDKFCHTLGYHVAQCY